MKKGRRNQAISTTRAVLNSFKYTIAQIVKHIFAADTVAADSDECCNALDAIQELNDER